MNRAKGSLGRLFITFGADFVLTGTLRATDHRTRHLAADPISQY